MKSKKISLLVVACVVASLLFVNVALAATTWFRCTVLKVGASPSGYIVYLKDTATTPKFTNRWFVLDPAHGKELLALAMTAYANGKILYIGMETYTTGSTISTAYMTD